MQLPDQPGVGVGLSASGMPLGLPKCSLLGEPSVLLLLVRQDAPGCPPLR